MSLRDFTDLFKRSLTAAPGRLHLAAHSHHLWPDAAFEGHMQAAQMALRLADQKWGSIFGELIPSVAKQLAAHLKLRNGDSMVFSPNTHDLLLRVLGSVAHAQSMLPLRILTTDGEFHSFERQIARWEELGWVQVTRVSATPLTTLHERLVAAAQSTSYDTAFVSHTLFKEGFTLLDLDSLVEALDQALPKTTPILIDGYHSVFALPVDLSRIENRVFYLGGGYKYLMSGEGACFMHCPPSFFERPVVTGWFASFGALSSAPSGVGYAPSGARFFGSTFDPAGLCRMNAVLQMHEEEDITVIESRVHCMHLARIFHEHLLDRSSAFDANAIVLGPEDPARGRFLTYKTPKAQQVQRALEEVDVICDARGDFLRFGFGIYQAEDMVEEAAARIASLKK
jgi:selenocysteine lyase/cysteine desulfurase